MSAGEFKSLLLGRIRTVLVLESMNSARMVNYTPIAIHFNLVLRKIMVGRVEGLQSGGVFSGTRSAPVRLFFLG